MAVIPAECLGEIAAVAVLKHQGNFLDRGAGSPMLSCMADDLVRSRHPHQHLQAITAKCFAASAGNRLALRLFARF
nr:MULTISPECIES: hypothetical protein [unclassified Desulfovibrio]